MDQKLQRHRADSLRQHSFLVIIIIIIIIFIMSVVAVMLCRKYHAQCCPWLSGYYHIITEALSYRWYAQGTGTLSTLCLS